MVPWRSGGGGGRRLGLDEGTLLLAYRLISKVWWRPLNRYKNGEDQEQNGMYNTIPD
jgi:hypothetical protein